MLKEVTNFRLCSDSYFYSALESLHLVEVGSAAHLLELYVRVPIIGIPGCLP
jgi:hypothetical protein